VNTGAIHELPVQGRHFAVDERGVGLRATWYLDQGFVNLSLWRGQICVETFHLTAIEADRMVSFLVNGMVAAVPNTVVSSPVTLMALRRPNNPPGATR
jgi:hypothetical protein